MNTPEPEFHTDAHLHWAKQRGLGSRPRMRMLAITAWISFLCGIAVLMSFLLMIPEPLSHMVRLDWLSGFFFVAWGCGFATALGASLMVERIWSITRKEP